MTTARFFIVSEPCAQRDMVCYLNADELTWQSEKMSRTNRLGMHVCGLMLLYGTFVSEVTAADNISCLAVQTLYRSLGLDSKIAPGTASSRKFYGIDHVG